jgi:tetratricopeptide (TPR) repeat protein
VSWRRWWVAALLVLACRVDAQSAAVGLYAEGNDLYRAGDFAGARARYEAAVATGVADPRLLYNLANAVFKTGDLGEAILWYERALKQAPRDEDIEANLRFLRRIKRDRDPEPARGIARVLEQAYLWPTLNEVALLWILSLFLLFCVAAWRRWQGITQIGKAIPLAAVVCLVVGGYAVSRFDRDVNVLAAIVTQEQGIARSGPDAGETEVFVIHEGTKVVVERTEAGWYLVRLASGLGGWLPESVLMEI